MKKVISLVLAVLMLVSLLCACAPADNGSKPTASTPAGNNGGNTGDNGNNGGNTGDNGANDGNVINVNNYTNDMTKWEFDDDYALELKDGKMVFNTIPGEFMAAMLTETVLDGAYKFTLTINELPEGVEELTPADGAYWDTEFFIIARASVPGSTWSGGEQTGYCISSWADMSTFCLGRAGADDALATDVEWNVNDGQPHDIQIGTKNIEKDGKTAVEVTVYVDGQLVVSAIDEGQNCREGRPEMYPEAGNLVIRSKNMKITVGGETTNEGGNEGGNTDSDDANMINVDNYLNDLSKWEFDDDYCLEQKDGKLVFNTIPGEFMAGMLTETVLDGSYKFTLTINELPEGVEELTPADGAYWDTEFFIIARASAPTGTWSGGEQTGYCISSWGDMSTFCLGRAGADDAFAVDVEWNVNDGQAHEIIISTKNIEKDGEVAVEVSVYVDGELIITAIDEGQNCREGRPEMYPEAGNLVIRSKNMKITIG